MISTKFIGIGTFLLLQCTTIRADDENESKDSELTTGERYLKIIWEGYKSAWSVVCTFIKEKLKRGGDECTQEAPPLIIASILIILLWSLFLYTWYQCRRRRILRKMRRRANEYRIEYEQFMMGPDGQTVYQQEWDEGVRQQQPPSEGTKKKHHQKERKKNTNRRNGTTGTTKRNEKKNTNRRNGTTGITRRNGTKGTTRRNEKKNTNRRNRTTGITRRNGTKGTTRRNGTKGTTRRNGTTGTTRRNEKKNTSKRNETADS